VAYNDDEGCLNVFFLSGDQPYIDGKNYTNAVCNERSFQKVFLLCDEPFEDPDTFEPKTLADLFAEQCFFDFS